MAEEVQDNSTLVFSSPTEFTDLIVKAEVASCLFTNWEDFELEVSDNIKCHQISSIIFLTKAERSKVRP